MLGDIGVDQSPGRLRDTLDSLACVAGGTAGELRHQRGWHTVNLPADIAIPASIDRPPRDAEQPGGVVGEEGVI